jgi:hypothetical protein
MAETLIAELGDIERLLERVRGEYLEMPGLRLTPRQAQRLWGLDELRCHVVFSELIDRRFLTRASDGAFIRTSQDPRRSA